MHQYRVAHSIIHNRQLTLSDTDNGFTLHPSCHFHKIFAYKHLMCVCTQSCPTLCNPMDCSLPASCVPWILQTRMLEWVAIPFSRDLPNPGIKPGSLALQADSSLSEALVSTSPSNKGWLPLTCCIFKGKGSWEFFVYLLVFFKIFFFNVDIRPIFLKVFIEYVTILLLFYVLVFGLQGIWDLSSLTRN